MNKSPEQYFQEQNFSADAAQEPRTGDFTDTERAFIDKYMGLDAPAALQSLEPVLPEREKIVELGALTLPTEEDLQEILRREPELLMVAFFLSNQEFVVPTLAVQEVIRYVPPAKLPAAPPFVAGVINLRGKITPLVRLRDKLEVAGTIENTDRFTIICRRRGLQLGLMIDRVHTMYRVKQEEIDWAIEARLGASVDFICGLLKQDDKLMGIISVDRIVDTILNN